MYRRSLMAGLAAAGTLKFGLPAPALTQGAAAHTLRFIPQADVTTLDPLNTTSYGVRNHGHMCWDTLYGPDTNFVMRPQLCEGHVVEDDGLRWVFTLRPGIKFHDLEPIRAQDAIASIARWSARDTLGQTLRARTESMTALDERRFEIRLKQKFGPMLEALGKPSSYPCFIFPERFATVDPTRPFTEVVGSGPYRFVASERLSGARVVYQKFAEYVPNPNPPSLLGGAKIAHFERVVFNIMPDSGTAAAAIQAGEIDWYEQVAPDLRPVLARNRDITVERVDFGGLMANLRFNHLHAPFDDVRVRRALLHSINQADFMTSIMGTDKALWSDGMGPFPRSSPLVNDEGITNLTGPRSFDAARAALREAGYANQPVTVLHPTDVVNNNTLTTVLTDALKRSGLNAESATSDWGTVLQRRGRMEPPGQGGWNALIVLFGGVDLGNPGVHPLLRANGRQAWFGWPTSPALEALRDEWLEAPDLDAQKGIARRLQAQFWQDVPFIPLGQYFVDSAWRKDISTPQKGMALPINVRRV
ncbi:MULTISPECIES: ABC transporter substrate-binding protein [Roseomonadaceae]|uniref:ABC transporter substrate-binding protein n=1 Tax=Falsiroseomonas oleicola TaxID=2801474 RepID=A0ABS6HCP1_9PROT|nr:ABC transporter substrate-binding protein [Roseomonas oleicola]MBU8546484.1 ABC transporter substrate-binding protein [Roseomonas oleicola]